MYLIQLNDLKECYLQKRRQSTGQSHKEDERDLCAVSREGYHPGLEDFQSVLATFTQYRWIVPLSCMGITLLLIILTVFFSCLFFLLSCSNSRLRVIAELRHGDLFHAANIISRLVKMLSFYEISFKLLSLVQKKISGLCFLVDSFNCICNMLPFMCAWVSLYIHRVLKIVKVKWLLIFATFVTRDVHLAVYIGHWSTEILSSLKFAYILLIEFYFKNTTTPF